MTTVREQALKYLTTELSEAHGINWYESLPDLKPPAEIQTLIRRYGLQRLQWKRLTDPRMSSRSLKDVDLIAMSDNDAGNLHVWYHELSHVLYRQRREMADRLCSYIRQKFSTRIKGWSYKVVQIGDGHAYSHSGRADELNEIFATLCALYWTGYAFQEDPSIRPALDILLK